MQNNFNKYTLILFLIIAICACAPAKKKFIEEEVNITSNTIKSGSDEFINYKLNHADQYIVSYYISQTETPTPLVIWIQGSGCRPVFIEGMPGDYASTLFSFTTLAKDKKVSMMVVDKPFTPNQAPRNGGVSTNCPSDFNDNFSSDSWVSSIRSALNHAKQLPWVDETKILILGISEGATVASAIANQDKSITNIALIGASGPSQLYDFIVSIYDSELSDTEKLSKIQELENKYSEIQSDLAENEFSWGHANLRWKSFFATSSLMNLVNSNAKVYLVSGMKDESVPILSTEALYVELLTQGKDVIFKRLPDSYHNLVSETGSILDTEIEYKLIKKWFLESN